MLVIIFVMPIVQLFIMANALTFDIKNLRISVVNQDQSGFSSKLIHKIDASEYFQITNYAESSKIAEVDLIENKADLYIQIPRNFEKDIVKEGKSKISVVVNAIDGTKAGVSFNYLLNILSNFQEEQSNVLGRKVNLELKELPKVIEPIASNWFNTRQEYRIFMVPGLVVLLLTLVGGFLTGINIVREKELGTIEQINVTPIKKYQFIIGKLAPFWILGMMEFFISMTIAILIYDVPVLGSPLVLLVFAGLYLTLVMGIGLLISTISETQQQALLLHGLF